jgi:copper chaperone
MSEHTYKFNVSMSCGGCSGAVDRVLKRLDGKLCPSPISHHLPSKAARISVLHRITWTYTITGVKDYNVSLENQTAEVVTKDDSLDYDTVLSTISKTGKKVNSGSKDGQDMHVTVATPA